jgi:hypothetical protein
VRASLERPDAITESAVTAREQIGRAVAEKIREVDDADDLKRVAEDVLPQIEKFLESAAEKRLRRMRAGVITAAVGLGVGIPALLIASDVHKDDLLMFLLTVFTLAVITFFVGVGVMLNGMWFTNPRKALEDHSSEARSQKLADAAYAPPPLQPSEDQQPLLRSPTTNELSRVGNSVTEHTTHLLTPEQ